MKKEFSFYEFVGIIVPSTILLFALNFMLNIVYNKTIIDFGKIGESLIFFIICYGLGHLLQGLGNYYEEIIWFIYGGQPTKWLKKKNRFGDNLFDKQFNAEVLEMIETKYGKAIIHYATLTYNYLFKK